MKIKITFVWLLAMAALALGTVTAAAASPLPFADYAPEGWEWWCRQDEICVLLPQSAPAGSQLRFLISARDGRVDDWLIGWLSTPAGEAEVTWRGTMLADDLEWAAQLGHARGVRALVAAADSGAVIGALSSEWPSDALVFNQLLKGGENQ
jgi:hypothetical protein